MSDDLASRFAKLQAARAADVIDEEAYQASLTRLRQQHGETAVNALVYGGGSSGPRNTQHISGNPQIGYNQVGDLTGNLTLGPIDFSRKTVVAGSTSPTGATPPATASTRPPLPATLSADGTHFTNGHALLIGVGTYKASNLNAPATAADAERLAALLRDRQVGAYPASQVRVLSGAHTSRQQIFEALDAFAAQLAAAPGATALLFFAGHGIQRAEGFYLLPYDYASPYANDTAISAAQFHEKVAAIRQHAQKLVVLLNCCHSGGVGDSVLGAGTPGEATGTPPTSFIEQLAAGSGHVVISAAKAAEKAGAISTVEPTLTVFGAQLVAALQGGALGGDPGIGVFDLFAFLVKHVPADAAGIPYGGGKLAQHPLLYAHQVDQNFALALRPNWQGGTLDGDLNTLIAELASVEIQLAAYASEDAAPALVQRRNDLLQQLGL